MSSPASPSDVKLEIGHVLFIDFVGYSKLSEVLAEKAIPAHEVFEKLNQWGESAS
jgi:hypothetical protein